MGSMTKVVDFMEAVSEAASTIKQGEKTETTCPICGGTVLVGKVKLNGHLRAHCRGCGMRIVE